jgi:hypothetical protein
MVQQSEWPCSCGSWYHEGGKCVRCGSEVKVSPSFYSENIINHDPTKKSPKGAGWDKKQHKVIWK